MGCCEVSALGPGQGIWHLRSCTSWALSWTTGSEVVAAPPAGGWAFFKFSLQPAALPLHAPPLGKGQSHKRVMQQPVSPFEFEGSGPTLEAGNETFDAGVEPKAEAGKLDAASESEEEQMSLWNSPMVSPSSIADASGADLARLCNSDWPAHPLPFRLGELLSSWVRQAASLRAGRGSHKAYRGLACSAPLPLQACREACGAPEPACGQQPYSPCTDIGGRRHLYPVRSDGVLRAPGVLW